MKPKDNQTTTHLKHLKTNYENVPIPEELDFLTKKIIKEHRKKMTKNNVLIKLAAGTAVAATLFVGSINLSPTAASAMAEIPIIKVVAKNLTFRQVTYDANIETPIIEGLANKELEQLLNNKYLEESQQLYHQFMEDVENLEAIGGGHLGVHAGYEVKADNEHILSIGRYVVNTVASSSTTYQYDTIDKQNQLLITLPSLFTDDAYVEVISKYLITTMKEEMNNNPDKIYWLDQESIMPFEKIDAQQNFYIDDNHKLVISFDKYEIAPGYMGVVEFQIPTEIIASLLVNDRYIK